MKRECKKVGKKDSGYVKVEEASLIKRLTL